jgi:hypothetical protein
MFVRFWLFVLSASVLIIVTLSGLWFWATILYFLTGVLWVWHDATRDVSRRRGIYSHSRFVLKATPLWPLLACWAAAEKLHYLRDPERFSVGIIESQYFPRWDEALAYAKKLAADRGEKVLISDRARSEWKRDAFHGPPSWKPVMWNVSPSGTVERFKYPKWSENIIADVRSANSSNDELLVRICFLRAIEWELWPLFLSQSILPILYLFMEWRLAWMLVCSLSAVWFPYRYRLANIGVATVNNNLVGQTRFFLSLGIAAYSFWTGKTFLGILSLSTIPIVTILFWLTSAVTPNSGTLRLHHIFLVQAGYESDASEQDEPPVAVPPQPHA